MSDLIERQKALDALTHKWDGMVTSVFDVLKELPSAEPERKTGHWIEHYGDSKCSECGYVLKIYDTNYCPGCGSYNGGEANEID